MKRLLLAFLLCTAAAPAPDKITVDLTPMLHNEQGGVLTDCAKLAPDAKGCEKEVSVSLGYALAHAVFSVFPDEQSLAGEQRWARGDLGQRIRTAAQEMAFSPEEMTVIKRCVGKAYSPLIVAQIFALITPSDAPPKVQ